VAVDTQPHSRGRLATPFLLPALADHGHVDVADDLLFQDTEPSWLYMIDRGATTIWEDWDGLLPDGTAKHSLNHYSKGGVISFLHRYVAGLQLVEPGYGRIRIAPQPGHGITHASTYHESPHGRIDVAWELAGRRGTLTTTVPDGIVAEIVLPDGSHREVGGGRHDLTWDSG
jgi:alpha-L-rhamnosidase